MTEIRGAGIDVRIRVEDLQNEETLFMLCEELGLHYGHRVREKVVALGTKIHEYDAGEKFEFTIENMVRTNPLLTKQIEQLAQEYGYDFRADIDG